MCGMSREARLSGVITRFCALSCKCDSVRAGRPSLDTWLRFERTNAAHSFYRSALEAEIEAWHDRPCCACPVNDVKPRLRKLALSRAGVISQWRNPASRYAN